MRLQQLPPSWAGPGFRAIVLAAGLLFPATLFAWSASDYAGHDFNSFSKLKEANERIDMSNVDYGLLQAAVFYETNRMRAQHKMAGFMHSSALEKAAHGHSKDMVERNFFSHNSPVKGKETMSKRLALEGIDTGMRAENIATSFGIEYQAGKPVYGPDQNGGYFSYQHKGPPIENHTYTGLGKAVVDQWMNSPGHRANILNSSLAFLGVGAYHFKQKKFYDMDQFQLTQNFASVKGP